MLEMSLPPVMILKMLWKVLRRWLCSRRDDWRSVLRVDLRIDVPGLKLQTQYRRYKRHKGAELRGKDGQRKKPGKRRFANSLRARYNTSMVFDFKKEYKDLYNPKTTPSIMMVSKVNYLAVRGHGDPNVEGGEYKASIGLLYAIAFTLKMSYRGERKIDGYFSYVVPPLEGLWWQDGAEG